MAVDFKLPDLGENIDSGDVISVLVSEGDEIQANQGVIELETGKAVVEVPSSVAGRISKIHVKVGDKLPIGATVLTVEASSAAAPAPPAAPQPPAPAPAPQAAAPQPAAPQPAPAAPAPVAVAPLEAPAPATPQVSTPVQAAYSADNGANGGLAPAAAPATRRLARELGVDLGSVDGSGPGGRITREDIVSAVRQNNAAVASAATAPKPAAKAAPSAPAASAPAAPSADGVADSDFWGPIRRVGMTKIRKTIAVNMARSSVTIPHVTNFDSADITELERIRKGSTADYAGSSVKLTSMAFVMKAVALALKHHGTLNASIDMDGEQLIYKDYVNLGVAVDTERGLVVPVIRNVDRMTIPQIAQALTDVATRARAAQFTLDDLRGGTFTLSNLGTVGGQFSTPIINHPEVAILLLGRSKLQPVVVNETKIEPRLLMPLSLSYDHRLVDGATAGRFLNEVINFLEVPGRLLLAP
ncbi:MAG: 2-oxo acid dehydrogenase subunit E2 [Planctomycetia bacterium]|nr:2-oxo acid dehydrogenase subunit E2 [Planctomycetia bacterium]